jgi:hypothetical protein
VYIAAEAFASDVLAGFSAPLFMMWAAISRLALNIDDLCNLEFYREPSLRQRLQTPTTARNTIIAAHENVRSLR